MFENDPPSIHDQTRATEFGRKFSQRLTVEREASFPVYVGVEDGYPKYTSGEQYAIKAAARDLIHNWSDTDFEKRIRALYDLMVKTGD